MTWLAALAALFILVLAAAGLVLVWVLGKVMPGMRVLPEWFYSRRKP